MEKWFDPQVYMANKLVQMQETDPTYTMTNLVDAFAAAGFVGEEGYYAHFVQYGANEDVAPNAFFNAQEYYTAKAAQFYGEAFDGSELLVAQVKALIQQAGMNAWTHYQQYGSAEGVDPSNAFDASAYCAAKAEAMNAAGLKDAAGNDWTADSIKTAIDQAGMSVLEHYLTYAGTGEGEVASGATYPVADDDQVVVPNPGVNIVVTNGGTSYNGTAGDDGFYVMGGSNLQAYHTLDGGEGNDTLFLDNQGLNGATIRNIENLVVNDGTNAALTNKYDMGLFATSFTLNGGEATVENVTSQKLVANGATQLVVNMAADQTSVDLTSQNRLGAGDNLTFQLAGDSLSSVKLAVDEDGGDAGAVSTINFANSTAAVTDLAITAADSSDNRWAKVDVTALEELANVTVAGAGAVELAVAALNNELKAVDATANTGGVTVDLSIVNGAAFTGGAGADELTIRASTVAHDLGAGDDTLYYMGGLGTGGSVAGGEGTDTIVVANDQLNNLKTDFANITGFEALTVTSQLATGIDMADYAGIDHLTLQNGIGNTQQIQNMQSGSTLELTASATNAFAVTVADAADGKADVLNIALTGNNAVTTGNITVADVETINVVATDTDLTAVAEHTLTLTADKATSVTVSGDAKLDLILTDSLAVNNIDASENTGGLTVNLATAKLSGITVTGSSAADTITLGFNNTVNGMGGDDIFTVTKAAEGKVNTSYSTIQGFAAGDKLAIATVTDVVNAGAIQGDTLEAAVTSAMSKTDSAATAVSFTWGNDTYVVMDTTNTANDTFEANDYLVKLAGVTGVEFAVDSGNLVIA